MTDHDHIRNLLASYSHCADNNDGVAYQSLFTEDGELIEGGMAIPRSRLSTVLRLAGKAADEQPPPFGMKHLQVNSWIEVDGENAKAITDLLIVKLRADTGWTIGGNGRYTDELRCVDGRWLFRRRSITWYPSLPVHPGDEAYNARLRQLIKGALTADL